MTKRKSPEETSLPSLSENFSSLEEKKSIFTFAEPIFRHPDFTKRLKELGNEFRDRVENPRAELVLTSITPRDQIIFSSILEGRLSELKKSHVLSLQAEWKTSGSPLEWAAQMGRLKIVEFLLQDQSKEIVTLPVLERAIKGGNLTILKMLFKHAPNLLTSISGEDCIWYCTRYMINALKYGATHSVFTFMFEKISLTNNEEFLLAYIIFLNSLGGFNFSSILSNYKEREKTILDIWMKTYRVLSEYAIRWGSLEFLQRLSEDYPDSFEKIFFNGKNILHLAIEYGRDLSIIKMLSERHRKCVFESMKSESSFELPFHTASKMGNLKALQHLIGFECVKSDVSDEFFRDNYQASNLCVDHAMVNGHTHILDYIKKNYSVIWKEQDSYSNSLTTVADSGEGENLLKIFQWYGEQFVCEWKDENGGNFLHQFAQIQDVNIPTVSWLDRVISKKISNPWEAKDSVGNTPLALAFRYKSASLFYVFALELPLGQYQSHLSSGGKIQAMWDEYDKSLSSFLSLYCAIGFSPRSDKMLPTTLLNHIFEYIAKKPSEMALMVGLKYFRQALLAKAIRKIYGDSYQARTQRDLSAIPNKFFIQIAPQIAQQEEVYFSAYDEASKIVRLASSKFTHEQGKKLKINVVEENKLIAQIIWFHSVQKGYNFTLIEPLPSAEQMKPFTFYFGCEAETEAPVLKYALLDEKGVSQMGEIKNPVDSKELPTLRDSFTKLATLIKNYETTKARQVIAILHDCFPDIIKSIQANGHAVPLDKRAGKYPTKADSHAYAVSLAKWWGKRGHSLYKGEASPPRPEFRYLSLG